MAALTTTTGRSPGRAAPATRCPYDDLAHLMTSMTGDEKRDASATSTLDVLWALHDQVLDVDPTAPEDPGRDRLLVSKGHGPMAYYAVLAAYGFLTADELVWSQRHDRRRPSPSADRLRDGRGASGADVLERPPVLPQAVGAVGGGYP